MGLSILDSTSNHFALRSRQRWPWTGVSVSAEVPGWPTPGIAVNKDSAVPFYQQLKELLTDAVRTNLLAPGSRLPSERELCRHFGVSRLTVRRALTDLTNAGLVFGQPGKGTYIQAPKLEQGIQQLAGLTEDMRRRGYAVTSRVLRLEVMPAAGKVAGPMRLPPAGELVLLERLRYVNGEPLAIERCYLDHRLCPGLAHLDLSGSLYGLLRQRYGLTIARGEQTYEAVAARRREAELLGISRGAPLLFSKRTTYLDTGEVIDQGVAWYRGDRYKFHAVLLGLGTDPNPSITVGRSTAAGQPAI